MYIVKNLEEKLYSMQEGTLGWNNVYKIQDKKPLINSKNWMQAEIEQPQSSVQNVVQEQIITK